MYYGEKFEDKEKRESGVICVSLEGKECFFYIIFIL